MGSGLCTRQRRRSQCLSTAGICNFCASVQSAVSGYRPHCFGKICSASVGIFRSPFSFICDNLTLCSQTVFTNPAAITTTWSHTDNKVRVQSAFFFFFFYFIFLSRSLLLYCYFLLCKCQDIKVDLHQLLFWSCSWKWSFTEGVG